MMKVRDIMAILAQFDPNSSVKVAHAGKGEVYFDDVEKVSTSFSGVVLQTAGFQSFLAEQIAKAQEKLPTPPPAPTKPSLSLVKP